MKMKTGDNIIVIAGKDRGRKGKVIRTFPVKGNIVVEGMNIRKKHVKARRQGEKGQVAHMPAPFNASNVQVFCDQCKKGVRVGYKVEAKTKQRVCRTCQTVL